MNEKEERELNSTEDKHGRRSFLKGISRLAIGLSAFGIATLFGLRRSGEIRLGKMKDTEFGLSEAQGMCSWGSDCAGGGGQCSWGSSCAGGGGKCSWGSDCGGS